MSWQKSIKKGTSVPIPPETVVLPPKPRRKFKKWLIVLIIILSLVICSLLWLEAQISSRSLSGVFYLQSSYSDWGNGNFAMTSEFPSGETKSEDMWHHTNHFISPPFSDGLALEKATITIYHQLVSNTASGSVSIEILLIDSIGNVQEIWSGNINFLTNSRVTSSVVNFGSRPILLKTERLYVKITVTTPFAFDWYWGNSVYPSKIEYFGEAEK